LSCSNLYAWFEDDFDRADSTTIGNGWSEEGVGNSGGGIPDASISGNELFMYRGGYTAPGQLYVSNTIAAVGAKTDLMFPSVYPGGYPQSPTTGDTLTLILGGTTSGVFAAVQVWWNVDHLSVKALNSPDWSGEWSGYFELSTGLNTWLTIQNELVDVDGVKYTRMKIWDRATETLLGQNDLPWLNNTDEAFTTFTYAGSWVRDGSVSCSLADNFEVLGGIPENCVQIWSSGLGMEADFNRDCVVNFEDFAVWALEWSQCNVMVEETCFLLP